MTDKPEVELATAILTLVQETNVGGSRGDTAAATMFGTYVQAHRRMRRIRDLAEAEAGQEAFILARTLLSMVARAIWIDLPTDKAERELRYNRWKRRELEDERDDIATLDEVGIDIDASLDEIRAQLDDIGDVQRIPNDRALLDELGLKVHYARLYRPASGYTHFTLQLAMAELLQAAKTGEDLPFDRPEPELAGEALAVSILTYALFLEQAEKTVRHGLGPQIQELITSSPAFADLT